VDSVTLPDEQALRAQLERSRETLDGLARNLRGIDAELEGLSGERQQHRLLQEACGALERLGELGGARLFWGERASEGEVSEHLRAAHGRIDAFEKRVGEIEQRRDALVEEIDRHQEDADFLEYRIVEALEQAEQRSRDWILEREVDVFPVHAAVMPWMRSGEEDRRFRKSLAISLLVSALFALVVPRIGLPLPELAAPTEVPQRLARLIVEHRKLPPPPVQQAAPTPEPEKALAQAPPAKPKTGPGNGPGVGPGTGPGKGILAFREKLSGFAENQALARLGSQAHVSNAGAAPSGLVERSMIAIQAPGSSGGINLAELSRGVNGGGAGGGQLEGVQIARATSTIRSGGGGGRPSASGSGNGAVAGRTDEEIQIVFDRYKASLYRLYNRELRSDPTLKGQMVLRIRIEPDGSVTLCELQATDMRAPQLVAQVLERVRTFDFGAKEVPAITILYPIDFLPAT
jgi:hypothetical protein